MAIEESEIVGIAGSTFGEDDSHQIEFLVIGPLLNAGH